MVLNTNNFSLINNGITSISTRNYDRLAINLLPCMISIMLLFLTSLDGRIPGNIWSPILQYQVCAPTEGEVGKSHWQVQRNVFIPTCTINCGFSLLQEIRFTFCCHQGYLPIRVRIPVSGAPGIPSFNDWVPNAILCVCVGGGRVLMIGFQPPSVIISALRLWVPRRGLSDCERGSTFRYAPPQLL